MSQRIDEKDYKNFHDSQIYFGLERIFKEALAGFSKEYGLKKAIIDEKNQNRDLVKDSVIYTAKYNKNFSFEFMIKNFEIGSVDNELKAFFYALENKNQYILDLILEDNSYLGYFSRNFEEKIIKEFDNSGLNGKDKILKHIEHSKKLSKIKITGLENNKNCIVNKSNNKMMESDEEFEYEIGDSYFIDDENGKRKLIKLVDINENSYMPNDYFFEQVEFDPNFLGGTNPFPVTEMILNILNIKKAIELKEEEITNDMEL